jgi:hypothetical protein
MVQVNRKWKRVWGHEVIKCHTTWFAWWRHWAVGSPQWTSTLASCGHVTDGVTRGTLAWLRYTYSVLQAILKHELQRHQRLPQTHIWRKRLENKNIYDALRNPENKDVSTQTFQTRSLLFRIRHRYWCTFSSDISPVTTSDIIVPQSAKFKAQWYLYVPRTFMFKENCILPTAQTCLCV